MDIKEFRDAIQSQINRYIAISKLAQDLSDTYLHTLVEDAYEYAQRLFDEFCVDKEKE